MNSETGSDLIGKEIARYSIRVDASKIKEMALAIGDPSPIHLDPDAAKREGYPDIIAGPTFGVCLKLWGGFDFHGICDVLQVNPFKVLHGQQEYEYFREITPGDTITITTSVENVVEKAGKKEKMKFITLADEFVNQKGERVLMGKSTIIERRQSSA